MSAFSSSLIIAFSHWFDLQWLQDNAGCVAFRTTHYKAHNSEKLCSTGPVNIHRIMAADIPVGSSMNSCIASLFPAWLPPLITLNAGTGSTSWELPARSAIWRYSGTPYSRQHNHSSLHRQKKLKTTAKITSNLPNKLSVPMKRQPQASECKSYY